MNSTRTYCSAKYVWIHPVVVPELELINVEGHVLAAHLMKRPDDATLEQ